MEQKRITELDYRDMTDEEKVIVKLTGTPIVQSNFIDKIISGLNKNAHRSEHSDHRKE